MRELIKEAFLSVIMAVALGLAAGLVFVGALNSASGCLQETLSRILP
jgi:hypothetical protein